MPTLLEHSGPTRIASEARVFRYLMLALQRVVLSVKGRKGREGEEAWSSLMGWVGEYTMAV